LENKTNKSKPTLLRDFLDEFFDFEELKKVGFFDKSIKKTDYEAQAKRVCHYFGLKSIYEYGKDRIVAHISYVKPKSGDQFLTIFPSIYD